MVGLEDSTHPTCGMRLLAALERLTDGWRTRDTNPKRKRGKNEREIPRLRFGLVWAESSLVCNPIVNRSR